MLLEKQKQPKPAKNKLLNKPKPGQIALPLLTAGGARFLALLSLVVTSMIGPITYDAGMANPIPNAIIPIKVSRLAQGCSSSVGPCCPEVE